MSKVRIIVRVINSETNNKQEIDAILHEEVLKYRENENTMVLYDYNENKLIRENEDLRMEYIFEKDKETTGILAIKELNKEVNLKIKTNKIEIESHNIDISFNIDNEEFNYKVEVIK